MNKRILFWIGIFLLLDGLLSIYFGNKCLISCSNNSDFGNYIRLIRAGIGGFLIYKNRK